MLHHGKSLFLDVDFVYKNCLTDRLIPIQITFAILSSNPYANRSSINYIFAWPRARKKIESFFAFKGNCGVYFNKNFISKSFLSHLLPLLSFVNSQVSLSKPSAVLTREICICVLNFMKPSSLLMLTFSNFLPSSLFYR